MKPAFTFYHDDGHGWLEVPADLVSALKLPISRFSYQKGQYAYLEEDCDAPLFLRCLGQEPTITDVYHRGDSPIRSYQRYQQ